MPQECFVYCVFSNGDTIHTSVNPKLSDDQIFNHYMDKEFTFARLDENDHEFEIKTKVVRLLITREEQPVLINHDQNQLPLPPVSISVFEQEAM